MWKYPLHYELGDCVSHIVTITIFIELDASNSYDDFVEFESAEAAVIILFLVLKLYICRDEDTIDIRLLQCLLIDDVPLFNAVCEVKPVNRWVGCWIG